MAAAQPTSQSSPKTYTNNTPNSPQPDASPSTTKPNVQHWVQVSLDAIGVTFEVPEGTRTSSERLGPIQVTRITPPNSAWILEITRLVDEPTFTPAQVADRTISRLSGIKAMPTRQGIDVKVSNLGNSVEFRQGGMAIPGGRTDRICERFRLKLSPDNLDNVFHIRDQVQFSAGKGSYIIFDFKTTSAQQPKTIPIFEHMLRTIDFQGTHKLSLSRAAGIEAGQVLVQMLGEHGIEKVFADLEDIGPQWHRYSTPDATQPLDGRREIGYRMISARLGQRSDIDAMFGRAGNVNPNPAGYIFQMNARVLMEAGYIDVMSAFFLSQPQQSGAGQGSTIEEWAVVTTQVPSPGQPPLVHREFGSREGTAMTVLRQTPTDPRQQFNLMIEGRGYLSQALRYVLPNLLVANKAQADVAFYCYLPEFSTNKLRHDSISPGDAPDTWTITSRHTEDQQPYVSTYTTGGRFISTVYPDGRAWEPTTKEELLSIWKRKGLPLQ